MTSGRTKRTKYQLRELPRHDYRRQLQGLPILRRALLTTTIEKATHKSVAATLEEREATQVEANMTTGFDQLAGLMAQIVQHQEREKEEHQQREEEQQQREEERQQRDEEYRREQERCQEEYRQEQEWLKEECQQWDEEYRREQERHQEEYRREQKCGRKNASSGMRNIVVNWMKSIKNN